MGRDAHRLTEYRGASILRSLNLGNMKTSLFLWLQIKIKLSVINFLSQVIFIFPLFLLKKKTTTKNKNKNKKKEQLIESRIVSNFI